MRFSMCAALALLVALPAGAAALADYGEMVCRQYGAKIPIDCACAGAPLQAEYDEDELVMIIQFVNNANDPNAKFEELMELEKKFGKDKLENLGKRFERLAEADMKACMKK